MLAGSSCTRRAGSAQTAAEERGKGRGGSATRRQYLGTFAVIFPSVKKAGVYRSLFELDSYAAIDSYTALVKDEESEPERLVRDESQFFDNDPNAQ